VQIADVHDDVDVRVTAVFGLIGAGRSACERGCQCGSRNE